MSIYPDFKVLIWLTNESSNCKKQVVGCKMNLDLFSLELTKSQFDKISRIVYERSGIVLKTGKEMLVKNRILKRLRALEIKSFEEYLNFISQERNKQELLIMIDFLTTNKTDFFREKPHFEYLSEKILPVIRQSKQKIRIWSAGCSSGEEPYSIAITLSEEIPDVSNWDARILATDISARMIEIGKQGIYGETIKDNLPAHLLNKYFTKVRENDKWNYKVKDKLRALVRFATLNLLENWPFRGSFDVIFCRNVMIYFDKKTQEKLVNRFWQLLQPGGYLFIGHSESLTGCRQPFKYIKPAIYKKVVDAN